MAVLVGAISEVLARHADHDAFLVLKISLALDVQKSKAEFSFIFLEHSYKKSMNFGARKLPNRSTT